LPTQSLHLSGKENTKKKEKKKTSVAEYRSTGWFPTLALYLRKLSGSLVLWSRIGQSISAWCNTRPAAEPLSIPHDDFALHHVNSHGRVKIVPSVRGKMGLVLVYLFITFFSTHQVDG